MPAPRQEQSDAILVPGQRGDVEPGRFGGPQRRRETDEQQGEVVRRNRYGREKTRTLWSRVPPALQLPQVFRAAVGREMRRTRIGGITIKSAIAVFG